METTQAPLTKLRFDMFRYPGGKSKLAKQILDKLNELYEPHMNYVEPFLGGGSIGLKFIKKHKPKQAFLSDLDDGIYYLWCLIKNYPDVLEDNILGFNPSLKLFDHAKHVLSHKDNYNVFTIGFAKLVVHQLSYSGLGEMGGPLGGKKQESKYKIDCRWNSKNLVKKLHQHNKTLNSIPTCLGLHSYQVALGNSEPALVYLDPPYYQKGDQLYPVKFSKLDHQLLSRTLQQTHHKWVLSYDNCPEIRQLYSWAKIQELNCCYTINAKKTHAKELLIYVH